MPHPIGGDAPSASLLLGLRLALAGLLALGVAAVLLAAVLVRVVRHRGRCRAQRDRALLHLGEARGRQAVLDDVRMLEHGQLKAHVLAAQQCIEQAAQRWDDDGAAAALAAARTQIHRLLEVVVSLHQAANASALPDDVEQTMVDVTRSLATAYPTCSCHMEVAGRRVVALTAAVRRALTLVLYNALTNAFTHAHPTHISVLLQYAPDAIILSVVDDGGGLTQHPLPQHGRGLRDMRQLVESLGGTLTLASAPAGGARVTALLPLSGQPERTLGEGYASLSLPERTSV